MYVETRFDAYVETLCLISQFLVEPSQMYEYSDVSSPVAYRNHNRVSQLCASPCSWLSRC